MSKMLRFGSMEELKAATKARPVSRPAVPVGNPAPSSGTSSGIQTGKQRMQALGRLKTGTMNKTEAAYAEYLEGKKHAGEIVWYRFEGLKFRLADSTFYTPDFAVMLASGALEAHEVKGFWQDDARAKVKIAADMYPLQFIAVTVRAKKDGGGWKREEF